MEHNRTRLAKRLPLTETSANVPLPVLKKPKLRAITTGLDKDQNKENHVEGGEKERVARPDPEDDREEKSEKSDKTKSARLVGDELKSWQSSWRKIMRESVVYFDTQGCDTSNQAQYQEQKRAQRALKLVGCDIVPFYDRDVSIIVSRRPFNSARTYAANDIFNDAVNLKIKVWDYDKVFRFLKNLGVSETVTSERSGNLLHLLKEEKIFGSTDRDPNARRDDLYYLEKNFLYVYDLSQAVRPIAVREWLSNSFPSFHMTLDGKCPFIPDTSDNLERKKLRRQQKFESTKEYREHLKKVSYDIISMAKDGLTGESAFTETNTSTNSLDHDEDKTQGSEDGANDTIAEQKTSSDKRILSLYDFKAPGLMRNSSVFPQGNNSNSKFYDVAASGYNGASNAMQYSMDSTLNSTAQQQAAQGNGLGPAVSQVPSKNINNLKRRIFMKRQLQKPEAREREKEYKPGYCENCRVKYDHFDDHIVSNRHRNFACNDKNFREIDDLIATLNESKSMGYVSSNGDFSFAS
ncbi:CIC11C00000001889 [Sungouiella intermedia]|uniref:CIC11C00000001889 n=1 Tax=Sungouiella intermedia TaxID=45354 RepID=A0A1L0BFD3_9ASCO|nr:CIC11C00000001889 [[Candida] intermedia]